MSLGDYLGPVGVIAALVYLGASLVLWGRPSTTESTTAIWAKSLLGSLFFFGVFMVALPWGAHRLLPEILPIPSPIRTWGGWVLFLAGVGAWLICLDAFSRRGRGTPSPLDAPSRLVTHGLHGVVRNPIIVAELMVVWAEVLYFSSVGILGYALVVTLGAHLVVVRMEEPDLRKRFGTDYESYCQRVPRWIPRLGLRGSG